MKYKGCDISQWNGNCDLAKAKKAGMNFVIIRSSFGNVTAYPQQIDTKWYTNVKKAIEADLPFGAYHYSYATTVEGMRAEAQGFVKLLNEVKPIPYFVALDIEEKAQYNLPQATLEAITKAFMDVVEKAGYFCALYSYENFLCKYSPVFRKRYTIWCANTVRVPDILCGVHQYSFTGRVDGISGNVDMDSSDIDYVSIIRNAGLNGYTKAKPILDKAGFKSGDKSLGVLALKQLLSLARDKGMTSANFDASHDGFYAGTEKAVNDILAKWGYQPNGIAGEKFIKKLANSLEK